MRRRRRRAGHRRCRDDRTTPRDGVLRAVATGAVALEAGAAERAPADDGARSSAAARLGVAGAGTRSAGRRHDFYRVYSENGSGRVAVVDELGAVPLAEDARRSSPAPARTSSSGSPELDAGSATSASPRCSRAWSLVCGSRILDLSDARRADDIVAAAERARRPRGPAVAVARALMSLYREARPAPRVALGRAAVVLVARVLLGFASGARRRRAVARGRARADVQDDAPRRSTRSSSSRSSTRRQRRGADGVRGRAADRRAAQDAFAEARDDLEALDPDGDARGRGAAERARRARRSGARRRPGEAAVRRGRASRPGAADGRVEWADGAHGHSVDEYLETIYFLAFPIGEYRPTPAARRRSPSRVAEMLGVSRASAGEMLKRLEAEGLIERGEQKEAILTEVRPRARRDGRPQAPPDRAAADRLHGLHGRGVARPRRRARRHVQDDMVERINERLGTPSGARTAGPSTRTSSRRRTASSRRSPTLERRARATIVRLAEHDGDLLHWFYAEGLVPGTEVEIASEPSAGQFTVRLDGAERQSATRPPPGSSSGPLRSRRDWRNTR